MFYVLSGCHDSTWRYLLKLNLFTSGLECSDCTTKIAEPRIQRKRKRVLCFLVDCLNSSVPRSYSSIFSFYSLSLFQAETTTNRIGIRATHFMNPPLNLIFDPPCCFQSNQIHFFFSSPFISYNMPLVYGILRNFLCFGKEGY